VRRLDWVAAAAAILGILGAPATAGASPQIDQWGHGTTVCSLRPVANPADRAPSARNCQVNRGLAIAHSQLVTSQVAGRGRSAGTGVHQVATSPDLARAADVAGPAGGPGSAGPRALSLFADSLALVALAFLLLTFVRRRPSQVRPGE
jgi:hypothetical protein